MNRGQICLLLLCGLACNSDNRGNLRVSEEVSITSLQDSTATAFRIDPPDTGELERRLINSGLVNIRERIPEVYVELKYSTEDNFFGKDVYGELTRCYMQPEVAEMLEVAYRELKSGNPELTFLIYDAVRPQSVQQILWDELDKPDSLKPLYVADPKVGSLHNYGVAVDLTLAVAASGEPLDMGTGYDFFGYAAYPDREEEMLAAGRISEEQVANRKILREVMLAAGFTGIGSEWWHFNAYSRKVAAQKFEIVK
ncbi:D-alanyl-D-alanine dipeptidase [Cyclobacterium lianum]|uniref:D-alanyl-D-alanine dipeptidase n=1 Tax=Cyclobacterium lianum TaxID=388280 RepID=A0A1M7PRE3_9BACT|nr:M15 family metallopeptidase [Cyclobacterium lianum]SHN19845.1 D-alanyl-D-alanine dipeptidase [Cyclobacterium lianum]